MRTRALVALLAGLVVLAGSFGVAAAGERKPALTFEGDCGCTAATRAQDRIKSGLIHPRTEADAAEAAG